MNARYVHWFMMINHDDSDKRAVARLLLANRRHDRGTLEDSRHMAEKPYIPIPPRMVRDLSDYAVMRLSEPECVRETGGMTTFAWRKPKAHSLEQFFALGYTSYADIPFSRVYESDDRHVGLGYHDYVAQERHDQAHIQAERDFLNDYAHDIRVVQEVSKATPIAEAHVNYHNNGKCYLTEGQRHRLRRHRTKDYANYLYNLSMLTHSCDEPVTDDDGDIIDGEWHSKLDYELGWVEETVKNPNAFPSQQKIERTPCGFVIPKQFVQANLEKTRQEAIIQHEDKETCDVILSEHDGWKPVSLKELLRYTLGDLVQENGYGKKEGLKHDGDGRGRVAVQLFRSYTDPVFHKHHQVKCCLWLTRDLQGVDKLEELSRKYPSVFLAYGSPCVTYFGKQHTAKLIQHVGGVDLDVDDVTPEGLRNILTAVEKGVLPSPSFISTSRSGLHLFFATKEVCHHDGDKREKEFAGKFGMGSGTAEINGVAMLKRTLEDVFSPYCGKNQIDHLSLTQLCGLPGTPTKQMTSEINNGYDYYGTRVQKYTTFMSPTASAAGNKLRISDFFNYDVFNACLYERINDAIATSVGLQKKSKYNLSTPDGRNNFITRILGIDMHSPASMRDSVLSMARGWSVKYGAVENDDDGQTIISPNVIDEAILTIIGLTDFEMFKKWQDGARNGVDGRAEQKERLQKAGIQNTYHGHRGENGDIDDQIVSAYYQCIHARPDWITYHKQKRYHEYKKALTHVRCGGRAKSIRELILAGVACHIKLHTIVEDAYELMDVWNEQDPLDDMDWHELREEELVDALTIRPGDMTKLFNWHVAYSISGISDLYPEQLDIELATDYSLMQKGITRIKKKPGRKRDSSKVDAVIKRLGIDAPRRVMAQEAGVTVRAVYYRLQQLREDASINASSVTMVDGSDAVSDETTDTTVIMSGNKANTKILLHKNTYVINDGKKVSITGRNDVQRRIDAYNKDKQWQSNQSSYSEVQSGDRRSEEEQHGKEWGIPRRYKRGSIFFTPFRIKNLIRNKAGP